MKVQVFGLSRFRRSRVLLASMLVGLLTAPAAMAGPEGGRVVRGDGNIVRPDAVTTDVNQFSRNMVVDWNSFNVDANETVNFHQPSSTATALNQIWDQNASQILGSVNANGRVILVNPNGIFFGRNASVDVGSLIASGLDIDTDQFMQGNWSFNADGDAGGLIVNQGLLRAADGGSVSLFGGAVQNSGTIIANYGAINLAAGETVTIDFDGDGLLQFAVDGDVLENANGVDSAVANTGELVAHGGSILLSANAARDIFSQVVNNGGLVEAGGVATRGGRVFLTGSGGDVVSSGTINASGAQHDGGFVQIESDATTLLDNGSIDVSSGAGKGGKVRVLGEHVGLFGAATIDASGTTGGGEVLIGGDYQGDNATVRNAARTFVGTDASIDASATQAGDGGKVIVWSDQITRFYGDIAARGAGGGDGGFAEVSGLTLVFAGFADLSGATAGTLLLDPDNITIQDSGTETDLVGGTGDDGDPNTYAFAEDAGSDVTIDADVLTGIMDGGTTVTLQAHDDITINEVIDASGSATAGGGLTLQAGDDIFVNFDVLTNDGAITFTANDAGATPVAPDGTGDIVMADGVTIDAGTAAIVLSAEGNVTLENLTTSGTIDVTSTDGSIVQASADMLLTGSTVTLLADTDIGAGGAAINTTAANLDLTATTGDVFVAEADGVTLDQATAGGAIDIATTAGSIDLAGAVTATTTVDLEAGGAGSSITDTAGGNTVTGTTVTLVADTDIGNLAGNAITTDADNLDLTATNGDAFVSETDGVTLDAVTAGGAIDIASTTGNLEVAGAVTATTTVDLAATAGSILDTAGTGSVGGTTVTLSADADIGNLAGNAISTAADNLDLVATNGDVSVADTDDVVIDNLSAAGDGRLAAGGALTDSANATISIAGNAAFSGSSITLGDSGTDTFNAGTLTFTSGGIVTIAEDSATVLSGTSTAASLDLDSADSITNDATADLNVTGLADFADTGGAGIVLGTVAGDAMNFGSVTFNSTGTVIIAEDSASTIAGTNTAGVLDFDSTGNIGIGTITVATSADIETSGGNINDLQDDLAADISGPDVTLTATGSIGGNVAAGNTTDTREALEIDAGTLDLNAGNVTVTDMSAGDTTLDFTGDSFDFLSTSGDILIDAVIVTGTVSITAQAGSINDAQDDNTVDIAGTTVTLSATDEIGGNPLAGTATDTAGAIELDADNIDVTVTTAGDIVLSEADGVIIDNLTNASGDAALTAGGAITDSTSATISVAGSASFSGTSITLGDTGTDAFNVDTLTFNSAGAVDITEDSATVLSGISAAGSLDLVSGGSITDNGTVDLTVGGHANFEANGGASAITLDDSYDFDTLSFAGSTVTIDDTGGVTLSGASAAGSLDLASTGAIDDDGTADLAVTGNAAFDGTSITLEDTYAFGTLTFNSAGDVFVVENDDMRLAGTSTADNLTLFSGNGGGTGVIDDDGTADVTVTGHASFNSLTAADAITLDDTYSFGSLSFSSGGAVTISEADAMVLSGLSTADSLSLTSSGSITDDGTADLSVVNNAAFDATSITVNDAGHDFGSLTFTSTGAVTIVQDSAIVLANSSSAGTLDLTANGSITDTGDVDVSGGTATFTAGAANNILLDSATNDFDTVEVVSGNNVTLRDVNGITLDAITASGALDVGAADGITVNDVVVADGANTIDADTNNDGTGTLTVSGSVDTTDNTLDIVAADIDLTGTLDSGAAATTITASNDGDLGIGSGAGDLALSDAELNLITATGLDLVTTGAGVINVAGTTAGNTGNFGALTLNGASGVNVTGNTTFANNVEFTGAATNLGADVTSTTGGLDFSSAVTISADAIVTAGTALNVDGTVTGNGGTENLTLSAGTTLDTAAAVSNLATFTVTDATVANLDAITTTGAIDITADTINLNDTVAAGTTLDLAATDGITIDAAVSSNGAMDVDADANNDGTGTLTVSGTGSVDSNGNTLDIVAADIDLTGTLDSGAATTITASNDGDLGIGSGAGDLALSDVELNLITATGLDLVTTGAGVINVAGTTAGNTGNFGALTLNGASGVNVTGNTTFANNVEFTGAATNLGANVTSTGGGLDFSSAVTVSADAIATAGTSLNIDSTVTGSGTEDLDLIGDTIAVTGNIGSLASFDADGTTSIAVAEVATSGAQSYTGATTLNGNVSSANGDIVFNDDITIGANISVTTGGGITLAGVDASTNTVNFRVDSDNNSTEILTVNGTFTSAANITFTGGTDANDTLAGPNEANTWVIDGTNDGSLNGADFTDFANLTGGSDDDIFQLVTGGSLSGTLDGGAETGADVLDVSGIANETIFLSGSTDNINAFTDIEEFTGNGSTVLSGGTDWNIDAQNAGTVDGFDFSGMANIAGTAGADDFAFTAAGEITGSVDGLGGSDTIDLSGYGSASDVVLTALGGTDGFAGNEAVIAAFDNIDAIIGATGQANTLTGINAAADWAITGTDDGTYTSTSSLDWTDFGNLTGGTNADDFTLAGGTVSGTIDGGTGTDTLTADDVANTWNITGNNAGDVTGVNAFTGIENLTGGSDTDNFVFADGITVSGTVDGNDGSDTLDVSAHTSATNVTLAALGVTDGFDGTGAGMTFADINAVIGATGQTSTLTGIDAVANWNITGVDDGNYTSTNALTFTDFANLTGGTNADTFTLSGGTVSGTVDGGTGTDTVVADNIANTWNITASNAGDVTGVNAFTGIENLTGGTNNDTFAFIGTGSVAGTITGGGENTADTLDYSGYAGGAVTVNLETGAATATGGFADIEALVGSGNAGDTLIAANDANAWTLTAADTGDVDGFDFDAIENLTGGNGVDTFDLAFDVTGTVSGGAGDDVFNITDGVTIGALTGGTGTDTLAGDDVANTWTINGTGSGNLNGQAFTQVENLAGGTNTDDFVFQGGGSVTGDIDGNTGTDTLDYSGYTGGAVTVNLETGAATATGGFTDIEALIGSGNGSDTLVGENSANTWTVNAANSGDVNGFAFSAIENLTGGNATDEFDLSAGTAGTISGGAGTDVIDVLAGFAGPGTQLTLDAETVSNSGGGVITVGTLSIVGATSVGTAGARLETDVTSLVLDVAGDAFITESSALNVSGTVGNGFALTAGGSINQGASLTVGGTADLQNTAGNINLNNAGNDFDTVLVSSTGDVTLRDTDGIDFDTTAVTGDLTVTAGGNVTDSGNLVVGGETGIDAGGNNVTLDNANDFASIGITADNATINDINALTLATSDLSGNLAVTAGALTLAGQLEVGTLDLGAIPGTLLIDGTAGITTANTDIDLTNFSGIDAGTSGSLALDAGSADIVVPDIGTAAALSGFTATATQISLADVTTSGGQEYDGELTLNGELDAGGAISVSGPVNLAGNSAIGGTTVDIDGTIDGSRALSLAGNVTVSGDIGAATSLQLLTTTGFAIELEGSVTTSGAQTYGSSVTAHGDLTGGSLIFDDSVRFPNGAIVLSDTIDFNGGDGSVSGDGLLTLLPATADGTIDVGGNSGDLNIDGAALNGYTGGLVIGGTYAPDQDHAVTNVARNIVVNDGIDTGAGTLTLISTHGISLSSGTLSGSRLILIASDSSGTILNPGGNQTQLVSNEIILVSGSSIGQQGEEIRARSASGAGVLQIASGAEESAISDPANSLQQLIGREAPLAFAIASQFGFTINDNLLVTNSAQSSANREQGGGLTDEGFIDPSLFEDISLYEVLGTGIALPADQSEEGYFEEDECGSDDEDCDAGIDIGLVMPQ